MSNSSKIYNNQEFFIIERSQGEHDDLHYLIGKKGEAEKMHVIVDKKTGEIRVEDNQIIDDSVAKKITATIELQNGIIIRTDRYSIINEPEEKNTLDYFIYLLDTSKWTKEDISHEEIWFSSKNYNFQIKKAFVDNSFNEEWTKVYPDKTVSRYSVFLYLNNFPIKEIVFISCDGGRIFVSLPDIEYKKEERFFYWSRNSLGFKIMKIIGDFYIYESIESVAEKSSIEIR
jgi:hypothetical protein